MNRLWRVFILAALLFLVLPVEASAADIQAKGYINGKDVDKADSRANAIAITDPRVTGSWSVKVSGDSVNFTRAVIDYVGFMPGREFSFSETIPAGGENHGSGSTTLPDWVMSLKGTYNVRVHAYDSGGDRVITRSFWITLGSGSPLTGILGLAGAAFAVAALALGVAAAAPGRGILTSIGAGVLMAGAAKLLILATGVISLLQVPAFVGATVGAGVGWGLITRWASKMRSRGSIVS